jgi:4-amino-4-deoxychorismate lyase
LARGFRTRAAEEQEEQGFARRGALRWDEGRGRLVLSIASRVTTMILINGSPSDQLPVSDRGLQYGDGLFETIAVRGGVPEYWTAHWARLRAGCERLGIPAPDRMSLRDEAQRLCSGLERAVLKIIVTRGSGGRGYRPPAQPAPTRILSVHPWPEYPHSFSKEGVRLRLCETQLGRNSRLAGIKHLNRLEQVLGRAEWDDPMVPEGIMRDEAGHVVEGTMSNLFMVRQGGLLTPDLTSCGVSGIARAMILSLAERGGIACEVRQLGEQDLWAADEVFVCNSVIGVWPVHAIEERQYGAGPVTRRLAAALAAFPAGADWENNESQYA